MKKELKEKIEPNYSLRKLIESYLNDDKAAFDHENNFFRLDFKKDLTEDLKERDLKEDKSYRESYTHLFNFLNRFLIPNYKNIDFQGCMIDMGMDYQTEYLVRHYLENPNKENYLRAIERSEERRVGKEGRSRWSRDH